MQEYIISGLTTSCLLIFHDYINENYSWSYKILEIYGEDGTRQAHIITTSAFTSAEQNELYALVSSFNCQIPFTDPNTGEIVDPDTFSPSASSTFVNLENNLIRYDFNYPWGFPQNHPRYLYSLYGLYSNCVPYILPFKARLKALVHGNYYNKVKVQIDIYKVRTNNSLVKVYDWDLTSEHKIAYNTDSNLQNIIIEKGEGLAVKYKCISSRTPRQIIVSIYVEPLEMRLDEFYQRK